MSEQTFSPGKPLKGMLGGAMAGVAVLALPQAALAAPVVLVCISDAANGQMTVDLDAAASTATITYPAGTVPSRPPVSFPARSIGPLAARFEPRSVTFDNQSTAYAGAPTIYEHFTVDRLTGNLLDYYSAYAPWDQAGPRTRAMYHYTCHVGTAQF